jgi:hypothetical protein
MDSSAFDMGSLFAQLGRDSDETAIAGFIATHGPIAGDVQLHEAAFWTPSQSSFLREALLDDADWAGIVDALNARLHRRH